MTSPSSSLLALPSHTTARLTGVLYLVVIVTPLASLALVQPHFAPGGDALEVARAIAARPALFRAGLALDLIMFASVLALASAQYLLLEHAGRGLALTALVLRVAEGILGCALVVTRALGAALVADGLETDEGARVLGALLRAEAVGLDYVLALMGVGTLLFGWLLYVSRIVPRSLSIAGLACYALLLASSLVRLLAPAAPEWTMLPMVPGTVFELAIGAWLAWRGGAYITNVART